MTPEFKGFLLLSAIKLLAIFSVTMVAVAYMTLMERWVSAWMQDRKGILAPGESRPAAFRCGWRWFRKGDRKECNACGSGAKQAE
jgi:hypothetical protein